MNRFAFAFRWAVIIGVVANLALAVPALFAPNAVLGMIGLPLATQRPMWPSFASLLLILLSLFYLPAAFDPFHYRPVAILAVLARFAGAVFFLGFHRDYWPFGALDLTFGVIEGGLLALAYAYGPADLEPLREQPQSQSQLAEARR